MSFENFKKRVCGRRIDGTTPEQDRQRVIKMIAVVEAAEYLLDHVNRDHAEWKEPLEKALAELRGEE